MNTKLQTLQQRLLANKNLWLGLALRTGLSTKTIERTANAGTVPHALTMKALWNATKGWRVQPRTDVSSAPAP